MEKKPYISVILTTYNRADWIKETIYSIINQTVKNIEIIIIDDGSYDNTKEIIESLKDKRIIYQYQVNQGVSKARNNGIQIAKGEWISFLDSDDIWFPNKLETQLIQIERDKLLWNHSEEIWIRRQKKVNPKKIHKKYFGRVYIQSLPLCIISPSTVLIHKKIFHEVGSFDTLLPVAEDYDMWLRISSRFNISFCKEPLIEKYGGHNDQLSKTFIGMDRFRVRALEKQLFSPHLSKEELKATKEEMKKKCFILYRGYKKHNKSIIANYYKERIKFIKL